MTLRAIKAATTAPFYSAREICTPEFGWGLDGLLRDIWLSLGVSVAGLVALMTYAFRSLRLGIVALLPNLIRMSIFLGSMGWLGLKVEVATAMM